MVAMNAITQCIGLIVSIPAFAAESRIVDVRALVWDGSADGERRCHVLLKNVGSEAIGISRSPVAYNESYQSGSTVIHHDCGISVYPHGFVTLPSGKVTRFELDLANGNATELRAVLKTCKDFEIWANFEIYMGGKKRKCSVKCVIPLGAPARRVTVE